MLCIWIERKAFAGFLFSGYNFNVAGIHNNTSENFFSQIKKALKHVKQTANNE